MWERKIFKVFLFFFYSLFVCFLLSRHEVWRDEVDVWLMVQELPIWEWRDYLRHSGHPGLFHLSLYPIVLIQGSFGIAQLLNCLFVLLAVGLLLFFSSLPTWFLGLAIFGDFILYRFPVFTRNYALGFLFLTLVALWSQDQDKKKRILAYISLVLLAHTHILFTLVSVAWGVFFLSEWILQKDNRKEITFVIVSLLLSGLLVLFFVYPPADGQFGSVLKDNKQAWRIALTYTLFPSFAGLEIFYKLSWFALFAFAFFFRKNISVLFLYILGTLLILFFFRFVYVAHLHHLSVLYVHVLFSFLVFYQKEGFRLMDNWETKAVFGLFILIFGSQVLFFAKVESQDMQKLYSGASSVTGFLKNCGWQGGDRIAGHGPDESKTILFYLEPKTKIYFPAIDRYGSFMKWNKEFRDSYQTPEEILLDRANKEKIRYLVWSQPLLSDNSKREWENCGSNPPNTVIDPSEYFYVYRKIEK